MHKTEGRVTEPVSVILPAYNEEEAIAEQIKVIRNLLLSYKIKHEIIVVDDGSQDRTGELALRSNARVLRHSQNRGYGSALKTGIFASQHETIVIIDADGTYPIDQIIDLIVKLENADMVVGARLGRHVSIPWVRRPAKWVLGRLATRIAGKKIPDLNSGMRAFRRKCVQQYFAILPDRFSFTTTITLALLNDNYRVLYHPIDYYRRLGRSKITPLDFMDFMMLILRIAILFKPLKIFLPIACFVGILGIIKIIFDIVALFQRHATFGFDLLYQPVISTSSILLTLAGLQLLLIGMVSDALLRRFPGHFRQTNPYHEISSRELEVNPQIADAEMNIDNEEKVTFGSRRFAKKDL
jgi:glycosyltransferase involved in cell wall biosynthesis